LKAARNWRFITSRENWPVTDGMSDLLRVGHADSPEVDIEKMKDVLGETVRFEQKRDRHYIDEKEKDTLLNGLIDDFLASTLPYFSEKDFAKKYALKEYKKKLEKASWYKT